MKKTVCQYTLSLFVALCLLVLHSSSTIAQEARGITLDEFKKVKAFKINNLEQDTYVKFDGLYAMDRYDRGTGQMVPPYTFKYSDGIERKIYLYKLLDNKTKKELGLVAVYTTPANGKTINLCLPTAAADKAVWAAYIDELKYTGEAEKGFLSTISYVFSRELSGMMSNGGQGAPTAAGGKTDYDVCFPEGALVTLADGSQKAIETIQVSDQLISYKNQAQQTTTDVLEVQIHAGKAYSITRLTLVPTEEVTASVEKALPGTTTLEATPNHPVLTATGRREMRYVQAGDVLYTYDQATHTFREMKVQKVEANARSVSRVYTLVTKDKSFMVNQTVVLDK